MFHHYRQLNPARTSVNACTLGKQTIFISMVHHINGFRAPSQLLIGNLANEGKTVLMVSSEMPELLGVCDRILVMSGGRLAGEVDAKNTTQEEIMTLAAKFA